MQSNHDDVTRWDETRQCFLDRNGYPANARGSIYNAATGMDGPINKILLEPTLTGTRIRSAGPATNVEVYSGTTANGAGGGLVSNTGTTALTWGLAGSELAANTTLIMNGYEVRLNGLGDPQFIRYNSSNINVEIGSFTGGRILTGSGGSTIAATWDGNGFQARKYMRSSGAFSASQGGALSIATGGTHRPLPLGAMTNTGVSGSAWGFGSVDAGNVLIAPFTGTIRVMARIWSFAPNNTSSYCHLRIYHPTVDGTFTDSDEGITMGALVNNTQDVRATFFAIATVNEFERVAITGSHSDGASKSIQVLDYHVEYIA